MVGRRGRVCPVKGCTNVVQGHGVCTRHGPNAKPRVSPYVYALHFPGIEIFKIGKSTSAYSPLAIAQGSLRKKGIDGSSGIEVWRREGSYREEQFLHAHFAYCYAPAFETGTKASEWYKVPGVPLAALIERLEHVWSIRPADMTILQAA